MLLMGEAMHVWGQGYMGNLCTFLSTFLQLLQKIDFKF